MYLDDITRLSETAKRLGLKVPEHIEAGPGALSALATRLTGINATRPLLLCGNSSVKSGLREQIRRLSENAGTTVSPIPLPAGEPAPESVNRIAEQARAFQPDCIIAAGGGSVIDAAKAVNVLLTSGGKAEDYLEGIGSGRTLTENPLPLIAVPTTAGTGAEMTENAVLASETPRCKKSMRDERMIPQTVILDPELTFSLPPRQTAESGMDAVTQLIESCISVRRKPACNVLAYEALQGLCNTLRECVARPDSADARAKMLYAAGVSGICLANAGLGMAHGIAAALGAHFNMPHGRACALLLPHVLEYNRESCAGELQEALSAFLGEASPTWNTTDRAIAELHAMNREFGIEPDLKGLELSEEQIAGLADASLGNSMSGNPKTMKPGTIRAFIAKLS